MIKEMYKSAVTELDESIIASL